MMLCFVFSALIVILDQFFKRWIVRTIELAGTGSELIPGVLGLTHWENDGAMLNFLSGQQWLLAAISLIVAVILVLILLRYNEGFWGTLGLAAVLGGTVGNLLDRVFNDGKVIDMFRTLFVNFPIFNIADIFITLGFITFLVHFIVLTFKTEDEQTSDAAGGRLAAKDEGLDYEESYEEHDDVVSINDLDGIYADISSAVSTATESAVAPVAAVAAAESEYIDEPAVAYDAEEDYGATEDYSATEDYGADLMDTIESGLDDIDVDYDVDDILREYGIEDD